MRSIKSISAATLALILITLPLAGWWKAEAIEDWFKLRNYNPPASIVNLANQDTMTPQAVHDFYVNHPQLIQGVSTFRQDCPESEQAIVLGCYRPVQNGIFIYDVQDARLSGVQQVTAAHEMLHGAYDRLSDKEKNYVDGLLEDYYKNDLTDSRIKEEIKGYKTSEPGQEVNEMHSIFGTEIAVLPAPLETYYKRYFVNRSQVVGFAQDYQKVFRTRQAALNTDKIKIDELHSTIIAEEQTLKNQLAQLNSDRARLDAEQASGQTDRYNSEVPGFNAEVDAYNSGVYKLQSDIKEYNSLVQDYNSLAGELRSLEQSIDTRLTPQAAQ